MKNVLIVGANSTIAQYFSRLYVRNRSVNFYLLARDMYRLKTLKSDLKIRGAKSVSSEQFDATMFETHREKIDAAFLALGRVDVVLLAHGTLPVQKTCEKDFARALEEINTNAVGVISLLTHIANNMEKQKMGTVAVITSVAGDKGRASNYVYGSAKAMVSTFLQGLRNRLHFANVRVLDIKPGFVDTPMTERFSKKGLLWSGPEGIAKIIIDSIGRKKHTVYAPFFWRLIMFVIKNIPESIFKRMRL